MFLATNEEIAAKIAAQGMSAKEMIGLIDSLLENEDPWLLIADLRIALVGGQLYGLGAYPGTLPLI